VDRNRREIACTTVAATLAAAVGFAAAHAATDGFMAYTLESARRLVALRSPAPVPDLRLDLVDHGRARLADLPAPVLLVDFIYTRCATYCAAAGSVYARLQERLAGEIAAGKVALLSISFDGRHDDAAALAAYRARHSRSARGWDLASVAPGAELTRWLDAFGVVVIPDELGGYAHNAAVHVVGPDRRLVAIRDLTDIEGVVQTARGYAGAGERHAALR